MSLSCSAGRSWAQLRAKFPRPAVFEASASSDDAVPVLAPPFLVPPEKQPLALGAAASRS
jgi:hypothetical protein